MIRIFTIIIFILLSLNANDIKDISLQLQWKHQFQFAGYYMAKEKGFYSNGNLNVNILEYSNDMDIVNDVLSNKVQFATGRSSLILNKINGDDIIVTASILQSSPNVLLGLKPKIKKYSDIKNKSIMITGDSFDDATIRSMLSSNGIKASDFKFVEHSFNIQDLINGNTDLMSVYISNEPYKLKKLGYDFTIFDPKDSGFDFYNDLLYTSNNFLENNTYEAKVFVEASLKGWEYAFNNIDETVDVIIEKYNTQNKTRDELLYEANELKKLAYLNSDKIGKIDLDKVQKIYEYYRLLGLVKNDFNAKSFVYNFGNKEFVYSDFKYLAKIDSINYCIDPNWMPIERINKDGKHIGISSDYIKVFEERLNVDFNLVKTDSWTETLDKVKSKECDLIPVLMETKNRKEFLNFTPPYIKLPLVIASRYENSFVNSILDIKDKKIGIVKGYAFYEILKSKYPELNLIEVENIEDGLKKVNNKKLYAYLGTLSSVGYNIQKENISKIKIIAKLDETWDLAIGTRKDIPELNGIMTNTIQNIEDSKKREIFNKWLSIKIETSFDYSLLYYAIVIFLIVLMFFLYKNMLMKRINQQLEELLVEKTKLAQIGEMIDSIAHQWKQPLNVISIKNSELKYRNTIDPESISNEFIDGLTTDIDTQVQLMSETVNEFRNFFREDTKKEKVDLIQLVNEVIHLNMDLIKTNEIKLSFNNKEAIYYFLYPNEFKHVFINLIVNAKDQFNIKDIENRELDMSINKNDTHIVIEVKDNAGGVEKSIQDKIFDMNVTTKSNIDGTGVGLYLSKQIVEKLGGNISIKSYDDNTNKGAIFTIELPV
mgnify:CR=1 FL=1